jgi:GT2 family glycosyltransferase
MRTHQLFRRDLIVATNDVIESTGELQSTGGDPHFVLKPAEPLRRGWYAISLRGALTQTAKVYFDLGRGFNEQQVARLMPAGDRHRALVRLHKPAVLIRLDPQDKPGAFKIDQLAIRRLTLAELGLRRTQHLAVETLKRPFVRKANGHAHSIMTTRGFVCLTPKGEDTHFETPYDAWIDAYDYHPARHRGALAAQVAALANQPVISVLMPVYNTPADLLEAAIQSVATQVYPHWELCIADDCSTAPHVRPILEAWQRKEPQRIKLALRETNGHIAHATNSAFALATGDWIALLDHDDILREHALAEVALTLAEHPLAELVYSDEDKIDSRDRRFDVHFKCDYSPELFRSMNYFNHLTVHRAANIRAVGGWRPGFEGSQDYDINLRFLERIDAGGVVHIPKVLYHWRAVEGSTALAGGEKSYAFTAGWKALEEHVARTGLDAEVCEIPNVPFYRLKHRVAAPAPLVSLIIPTRDKADLLRTCLDSIREKTTYRNYEILVVDNNSEEEETLAYFEELTRDARVRVVPYPHPFNYSGINNAAVRLAHGSIVGLVNNDIEVISPDWLTEMVSWAQQPAIGCVGAKLLYPDDTVQHAGVILGIGGVANHAHRLKHRNDPSYFGRAVVAQTLSAVTAACLLVRKNVYAEVRGLDSERLKVAFNDVDFCLKVRCAGYRNVWTPFAELYHHESKSRGLEDTPEKLARFRGEVHTMIERWSLALEHDPYYSEHLTRGHEDFSLRK